MRAQTAEESERELGAGERGMGKGDPEIVAFGPIFGSALPLPLFLFPPPATVIPPASFLLTYCPRALLVPVCEFVSLPSSSRSAFLSRLLAITLWGQGTEQTLHSMKNVRTSKLGPNHI